MQIKMGPVNFWTSLSLLSIVSLQGLNAAPTSGHHLQQQEQQRVQQAQPSNATKGQMDYLIKYGYMKNCTKVVKVDNVSQLIYNCSSDIISEAVKLLQEWNQLPRTGLFDERTVQIINTKRCGNPDVKLAEETRESSYNEVRAEQETGTEIPDGHPLIRNMGYLKKGVPPRTRQRRSTVIQTNAAIKFQSRVVRWRLLRNSYSSHIPHSAQRAIVASAFKMWSKLLPLIFLEDNKGHIRHIDIEIGFGKGSHMDCVKRFDGPGGEIAHSWSGGDIHFDDDETFGSHGSAGINLLYVTLHEIGHVLGLGHSKDQHSIMYHSFSLKNDHRNAISLKDRQDAQKIHGVCQERFDAVFDIVKQGRNNRWYFDTYFLRGDKLWIYNYSNNRPYYKYPKISTEVWENIPSNIDTATQVFKQNTTTGQMTSALYVFKGDDYYVYDVYSRKLQAGFPKKITDGFPDKPGQSETIPTHLDAVYFDWRNRAMVFIKGEWVWEYFPQLPNRGTIKKKFSEVFPMENPHTEELRGNIDNTYYSNKDNTVYFFKDKNLYKNTLFKSSTTSLENKIVKNGRWFEKWKDICDV